MQSEDTSSKPAAVETHARWIGILPSLLVPGAGQFLAGDRKRGIFWFFLLTLIGVAGDVVLASPWFKGIAPGVALLMVGIGLWLFMLYDSCRPLPRLGAWKWLVCIVVCLGLAWGLAGLTNTIVCPFDMPTRSMAPTLRGESHSGGKGNVVGDTVLVQGFAYWFGKPQRGDIVVFKTKGLRGTLGEVYVKRVVGLPGEVISIKSGRLSVDGSPVTEPRIFTTLTYSRPNASYGNYLKSEGERFKVPADQYFVIGDNSAKSQDSRYFGAVPEASIVGKVTKICWPPERIGVPE